MMTVPVPNGNLIKRKKIFLSPFFPKLTKLFNTIITGSLPNPLVLGVLNIQFNTLKLDLIFLKEGREEAFVS